MQVHFKNSLLSDKLKILFELERYDKLISLYRETASSCDDPVAIWYYTASLLEQKQYKEAIKKAKRARLTVQKVLESAPNDPVALSLLAHLTQNKFPKPFYLKSAS